MKKKGINLILLVIIVLVVIVVALIILKNIISNNNLKKEEQEQKTEKFSISMLEDNGLGESQTLSELENKFGDLTSIASYVEVSTGDNIDEYIGNRTTLILKNSKLNTFITTNQDFEFNGIKIGDSKDKVIKSFYNENKDENVVDNNGNIIGKYLYGSFTTDNLNENKITDNVEYAYIGNQSNDTTDYTIRYVYMEPPYKNEYASIQDTISCIEFGIKDDIVTTFASQILLAK